MKTLLLTISVIMMMAICALAEWPPGGLEWGGESSIYWENWRIVPDGQGGFWGVWEDNVYDIRIQHVDNQGNLMFPFPGRKLIDEQNAQFAPDACSDRNGGVIIAWEDFRNAPQNSSDIYAQRVDQWGNELWTDNGVAVIFAPETQYNVSIRTDHFGNSIISWDDARGTDGDVFAQCLDSIGNMVWDSSGIVIGTGDAYQHHSQVLVDSMDNFFVVWGDNSDDSARGGIYAQKISIDGNRYWHEYGTRAAYGDLGDVFQDFSATIDGHGGVFTAWHDWRFGFIANVFAAWVDSTGTSRWGLEGLRITTYPDGGFRSLIQYDHRDGAFLSWWTQGVDQRVQWVKMGEPEEAVQWEDNGKAIALGIGGEPMSLFSAGNGEWIINLFGSHHGISQKFDTTGVYYWGETGKEVWVPVDSYTGVTDGEGGAIVAAFTYYTLDAQRIYSDGHYSGETGIDEEGQQNPSAFCLTAPYPNPFNSATIIEFSLAQNAIININIYNILGEEVITLIDGFYSAGMHTVEWKGTDFSGEQLSSGIYFIALGSKTALGTSDIKRAVLVK